MFFIVGLFLLSAIYFIQVQPVYLKTRMLFQEEKALNGNLKRYQKYSDFSYALPFGVSESELADLGKKVPLGENHPEFVVQLQQAVTSAGATWVKMETLDDLQEIEQIKTDHPSSPSKAAGDMPEKNMAKELGLVAQSPHLKTVWVKLEVKATEAQLSSLLDQLQKGERLVTPVAWEAKWTDQAKPEPATLYLAIYYYEDERVKATQNP